MAIFSYNNLKIKNKLTKIFWITFLLFFYIWPFVLVFSSQEEEGASSIPEIIQEATSTPQIIEEATSTPNITEPLISESETASSTLEETNFELLSQTITKKEQSTQDEQVIEEESIFEEEPILSDFFQTNLFFFPPLKERKLEKKIQIDKNAFHSCAVNNFTIDISGQKQLTVELRLEGMRSDFEHLEIGSLPLGIDITFLSNADYNWQPQKDQEATVLQIINQEGSQKGNFSIPIIYQSGNSTTICQINVINF